ncbi:MAG: LPS assembly lipoprotein LptE [Planctomycetaceae bacterium]|nr:LPS assembly lipoprotein LptE [Planctomycetaceae bacterium]
MEPKKELKFKEIGNRKSEIGDVFLLPIPGSRFSTPCFLFPLFLTGILSLSLLGGCAGYRVGAYSLYNDHIKTVYVPMFESDSFRKDMGERLTEAVCKRIEERTPYKVVGRPTADSVLHGKLVSDSQEVLTKNKYNDVRQKQVSLSVEVVWVDRRGNELRRSEPIPWGMVREGITTSWDMVPEMGDSTALAQQKAIDRMAEQIVNMMENPW